MRVVLFAEDMEPITVLDLPPVAETHLERYGRVLVPVLQPIGLTPPTEGPTKKDHRVVEIYSEKFQRNGVRHMMLFTRDEEAAMLLRSALLPGQRRDAQDAARAQFARGFLAGLRAAMPG
jgi:hypothetical protein